MKKKMTVLLLAVMVLSVIFAACKSGVDIQSGELQPATEPATGHTQDMTEVPEQMNPAEPTEPDNGATTAVETEPVKADENESSETAPTESDWSIGEEAFDIEEETDAQDPTETEPAETEPVETEPAETVPVEAEPSETEPIETETAETETSETEPVETEPAEAEPEQTDPAETVPPSTESDEDNWNIGEEDF